MPTPMGSALTAETDTGSPFVVSAALNHSGVISAHDVGTRIAADSTLIAPPFIRVDARSIRRCSLERNR